MAYVDLNPIRAAMAKTLEDSDYTAVQAMIQASQGQTPALPILPLEDQPETAENPLPYYLRHYLELVDWTGRTVIARLYSGHRRHKTQLECPIALR